MKQRKRNMVTLFVKDNKASFLPITSQTQRIRNDTNLKIRELGNKYYLIKTLIERLNIKRDDLFDFCKQIKEEYKGVKKGLYLSNQNKRMKESLYCWLAEHFFNEILQYDSIILKRLASISKIRTIYKEIHIVEIKKPQDEEQPTNNKSFNETTFNQEIDTFDFSSTKIDNHKLLNDHTSLSNNANFDYDNLLNFDN